MLRLQAQAGMLDIGNPARTHARSVEEIPRVELHTRLGREDLHDAARGGFDHAGGRAHKLIDGRPARVVKEILA